MRTYQFPAGQGDVPSLTPESAGGNELTPETRVLAIHRGRHTFTDKYDGVDYRIAPGKFTAPYGAVAHLQRRAVIPGTRDVEGGTEQSYIGIIGIDDPALCEPLTDEEVAKYGAAVEAIDRSAMSSKTDRTVKTIATGVKEKRGGGSSKPKIETEGDTEAGREAASHALDTNTESDAAADAAAVGRGKRGKK